MTKKTDEVPTRTEVRQKANIGRRLGEQEKLEMGDENSVKSGKAVMMEIECSDQLEQSNRTPLKELNQNSQLGVGEEKSAEKNVGRRWRRKDGPEQNAMLQDKENYGGVGKGCGTKREWQKAGEEESISEASGDGKRMKFQKLGTDRNYIEVEVASFDWPQPNQ